LRKYGHFPDDPWHVECWLSAMLDQQESWYKLKSPTSQTCQGSWLQPPTVHSTHFDFNRTINKLAGEKTLTKGFFNNK